MKRYLKWLLLPVVLVCAAAFAFYFVRSGRNVDHTAPTIFFAEDTLSMSVHDDESLVLEGVTARDNRDGDVTGTIVVEGISAIRSDHTATVTYAAFDQAGNVTKATRTISYIDYSGPKFALSAPLIFRSGASVDLFRNISAADPLDGDLTDRVRATLTNGTSNISEVGLYEVELRVTNSMGETARITVPVESYADNTYNATVTLTDYLIYLKKGASFDARSYLRTFGSGSAVQSISQIPNAKVNIQSDVQTSVPGTYSVTYTISHDGSVGFTRLIVIVED